MAGEGRAAILTRRFEGEQKRHPVAPQSAFSPPAAPPRGIRGLAAGTATSSGNLPHQPVADGGANIGPSEVRRHTECLGWETHSGMGRPFLCSHSLYPSKPPQITTTNLGDAGEKHLPYGSMPAARTCCLTQSVGRHAQDPLADRSGSPFARGDNAEQ